uniref:Uncharacterized protein n=1 Tax=Setaria digitata TaxID=48799 RepID=A0A915PTX1_9BILA
MDQFTVCEQQWIKIIYVPWILSLSVNDLPGHSDLEVQPGLATTS